MGSAVRTATRDDVAAMMEIRLAVRENVIGRARLAELGIDEESLSRMLATTHSGFCVDADDRVVAFAMGDRTTAEIFALFVRPEFEGRGAGTALLDAVVADLLACGHARLSLGTEPGSRAYEFYRRHGWRPVGFAAHGDAMLEYQAMQAILKRFDEPDEVTHFPKGRFETIRLGPMVIGRATYEPGWKWSVDVGAELGETHCTVEHVGMVLAGAATAAFADGTVTEMKAGDFFYVPGEPHDSWVVGDEPYVSLHFLGAHEYARSRRDK